MIPDSLKKTQRRQTPEPEIKVWDALVRIGHWLMVLAFGALYLRYRAFPLHTYAGYLVTLIIVIRIFWGLAGSKAARFRTFWYSPREMLAYALQALRGHAPYYYSHNPMGAAMVYALLSILLLNVAIGLMLYSSGQELGPLGAMVPSEWEDTLTMVHRFIGHTTALLVSFHLAGVLWAVWLHRENYVLAMLSGFRRVPRSHTALLNDEIKQQKPAGWIRSSKLYHWLDKHPMLGSILLATVIILTYLKIIAVLVVQNKFWISI